MNERKERIISDQVQHYCKEIYQGDEELFVLEELQNLTGTEFSYLGDVIREIAETDHKPLSKDDRDELNRRAFNALREVGTLLRASTKVWCEANGKFEVDEPEMNFTEFKEAS